jgi:hypothetical protein
VSEETRKNLLALAIVFGVVALVLAFAIRPGVVLPTTKTALANSVAGDIGGLFSETKSRECVETSSESVYDCRAQVRSYEFKEPPTTHGGRLRVKVDWTGCWVQIDAPRTPRDGCISILDY